MKLVEAQKRRADYADSQHNRGPGPRALSKSGARGPSGMALFNYCNGLVGRVRPAMSAGSPAPAPGPRTNGGGRGRGGFQPGLAVRAQNIGLLAQVLAGALFAPARRLNWTEAISRA